MDNSRAWTVHIQTNACLIPRKRSIIPDSKSPNNPPKRHHSESRSIVTEAEKLFLRFAKEDDHLGF